MNTLRDQAREALRSAVRRDGSSYSVEIDDALAVFDSFSREAASALEAVAAERDLAIAAVGEPCAECGHIDWRSDPNPLLERAEAAEKERDEAREALRPFADRRNWTHNYDGAGLVYTGPGSNEISGVEAVTSAPRAALAVVGARQEPPPALEVETDIVLPRHKPKVILEGTAILRPPAVPPEAT